MPEGVMRQADQDQYQDNQQNQDNEAEEYVNDLIEKASAVSYKLPSNAHN